MSKETLESIVFGIVVVTIVLIFSIMDSCQERDYIERMDKIQLEYKDCIKKEKTK